MISCFLWNSFGDPRDDRSFEYEGLIDRQCAEPERGTGEQRCLSQKAAA